MQVSFLFWNLKRQPLQQSIASLAEVYDLDVIILAECAIQPVSMLLALNRPGSVQYRYAPTKVYKGVEVYSRIPDSYFYSEIEEETMAVWRLQPPGMIDIAVVTIHFPSKWTWDEDSQAAECQSLALAIRDAEQQLGHSRTVLVGDLNMNPFEAGMVNANGLNAVMSRSIAARGTRTVRRRKYPYFYNPMWNFFGDQTPGPPGSIFYDKSKHKTFFWNIFDQVLVRPTLLDRFATGDVAILSDDGSQSLLGHNGRPRAQFSDHLPLLFRINLETN